MRQLALLVVVAAAACSGAGRAEPPFDRGQIQVAAGSIAVKTGPVGEVRWRSQATYALVEARNRSDRDAMVTLGGALRGADGAAWPVRRESLRVPAGGTR